MSDLEKNAKFANLDDLFDADIEDLEELPPLGVPPTGNYNLSVTAERGKIGEQEGVIITYTIDAINEVNDDSELTDVKVGQSFTVNISSKKKDGSPNTYGIAAAKEFILPFAAHFGESGQGSFGRAINKIQNIQINATVRRKPAKDKNKNILDGIFNARVSNIIVL